MTDKSGSCRVITFAPVESLDDFTQERLEEFFDVVSVDYTAVSYTHLTLPTNSRV